MGAVLEQLVEGVWEPLGFFFKNNEIAHMIASCRLYLVRFFFQYMVEGRFLTYRTDHKPLIFALRKENQKKLRNGNSDDWTI